MTDRDKERDARNTYSAVGSDTEHRSYSRGIEVEISDALHLAAAADLQSLMRLLRMAKFEVSRLRQRPEYKDKS